MKHKIKKLIKARAVKRRHLYGLIAGLTLFFSIIAYALIPNPTIDDGYLPNEVRKISHRAPFTIRFSQLMNKESVEQSFSIDPDLSGSIEWLDGKTLEYHPSQTLKIGDEYIVSIDAQAQNLYLKELGLDLDLSFVVSGAPYVKFISPYQREIEETPSPEEVFTKEDLEKDPSLGDQIEDMMVVEPFIIQPDQKITVMFDRPMRPLTNVDSISDYEIPELIIEPPVKGDYKWVGTTAFQFIPEEWTLGTTYNLTLPKGIKALDGGKTDEEINWQLATEDLKVISHIPYSDQDDFSPEGVVRIQFNQPVDLDDIRPGDNVLLYPSNDVDADQNIREDGFFNTEVAYGQDDKGVTDKTTLVFKPEFPYQYDQNYKLTIASGLSPVQKKGYGDRSMASDFSFSFKTVKKPGIVRFEPASGDRNYKDQSVYIDFASPMTAELIRDRISIQPKATDKPAVSVFKSYTDNGYVWRAEINYSLKPSTDYSFSFSGPFVDEIGNQSDKSFTTVFKTAPRDPYLQLLTNNSFGLFTEGLKPIYSLKTVNINRVNVRVCDVSESDFFRRTNGYNWYQYRCPKETEKAVYPEGGLNKNHQVDLNLSSLYGKDFNQGIYFMEVSSPDYTDSKEVPRRFHQTFFISETNLALKKSSQDLLVWATDLKTGQPVPRMDIKVLSRDGNVLQTGVTDGEGVYKISKNFEREIYVIGTKKISGESRWSIVSEFWNQGIQSWQYSGLNGEWIGLDEPRIYLYTDRPLYKPGDEIFFKGLYRIDRDASFSLPNEAKIQLVLEDAEYNEVDKQEISLLTDGSFNGRFKLSDKARLGRYNVYAETLSSAYSGQRFYHHFFVEEYKKPKFKIDIIPSKESYMADESIEIDIQANYFFGGGINGGEVDWTLTKDQYFFDKYEGDRYFSFSRWLGFHCFWDDCRPHSKVIESGVGELDAQGNLRLSIEPQELEQSALYTLEADIKNIDGEVVSERKTFVVHLNPYYVGLSTDEYLVAPGENLKAKMVAVSPEGELLEGQKVQLNLYREEWNTVKKQGVDGAFYEESVLDYVLIQEKTVVANGLTSVDFTFKDELKGGQYVLRAMAGDSILSELSFYFSSGQFVNWGSSNNNRMELVADRSEYFIGGKARVLIKSPYGSKDSPVKALITYERGSIQDYEVIDIDSNSAFIEVPINEEMAPNVYISAMVVKGPGEKLDQFIKSQDEAQRQGQLSQLEANIEILKGEISKYENLPDDERGNRESILLGKKRRELTEMEAEKDGLINNEALKADADKLDFNLVKPDFKLGFVKLNVSRREHEINIEITPSKQSYKIGEPVEIEIHTNDYQNRPIPSVVSLAVVDQSLLALKSNQKSNPLDYFYSPRALQVNTSSSLTLHVDRVNVESGDGAKGGGGGGGIEDAFDKKRGDFKDTAYFNPIIQTDQGGFAKITFDPPDNLTTWEIWAVASSKQSRFGMKKSDFVVKKEVSLSPIIPQFLIGGDELTIGALVHNQSDKAVSTKVELIAPDLEINGGAKKSVSVPVDESRRVDFSVKAKPVQENKTISIELKSEEDIVVKKIPVSTFAYPEVVAINNTIEDSYSEKVRLPEELVSDMGYLKITAGGNILTSFIGQFKALADYPYGCAEQLMSQILPTLVVQNQSNEQEVDLFKWLNLDREKNIEYIKSTLQNISKFQRFDGGYGFWEGSEYSYPMLTAYVLYAQHLAENADFSINENSKSLAAQYLWNVLNSDTSDSWVQSVSSLNDRAFVLWVLSETGVNDTGMTISLFEKRDQLSLYARALMLMNLDNLLNSGQSSVSSFIRKLKAEIVSEQIIKNRTVHFEEENASYFDLNTNLRTTAMILMALNRDNPDNPILPNMISYLVNAKSKGQLLNTQETAWLLLSMLEYADDHDVLRSDFEFNAKMNDSKVLEGNIDLSNLNQIFENSISLNKLRTGSDLNEVKFTKEGEGQMIFNMELKYFFPNEKIQPQERGFHITRSYYHFEGPRKDLEARTFKSGEIYKGEINIIVPEDRHQVVVEERLPAGFEAINFNLDTAPSSLRNEINVNSHWYDNPLWRFNHKEMRHDRVLLFADYLPKGVYTYEFLVRAGLPGDYHHLPASAQQMYFPEVFGRTEGRIVRVKD